MKYLTLIFVLFTTIVFAQSKSKTTIGVNYRNYWGGELQLKPDSSFKYTWRFDLELSWNTGKWTIKNDTIYLRTILVYDTLRYVNVNGKVIDTFILAECETPAVITKNDLDHPMALSTGGQNRQTPPKKLYYFHDKLFEIDTNGKLIKKKIPGFWNNKKKWGTWYFRFYEKMRN